MHIQIGRPYFWETLSIAAHINEKKLTLASRQRKFFQQQGRRPTVAEMTELTGFPEWKVRQLLTLSEPVSLQTPVGGEGQSELGDMIADHKQADPGDHVDNEEMVRKIGEIIDSLSARDAEILRLRHGFGTGDEPSLRDVGAAVGLSRERVRQLEKIATEQLREKYETDFRTLLNDAC